MGNGIYIGGMGLANILTISRVVMVPLVVLCFYLPPVTGRSLALLLFVLAAVTDYYDGYFARKWGQTTPLGIMLDPIADKLLIAIVLLMLVADNTVSGLHIWAAAIILFREVFISGMREFLAEKGVSVPVTSIAKWKTTIQMVALAALLGAPAVSLILPFALEIGLLLLWLSAALTLYTGIEYFKGSLQHLK